METLKRKATHHLGCRAKGDITWAAFDARLSATGFTEVWEKGRLKCFMHPEFGIVRPVLVMRGWRGKKVSVHKRRTLVLLERAGHGTQA